MRRRHGRRFRLVSELLGQGAAVASENHSCRGLDQDPAVLGDRASGEEEHPAGLAEQRAGRAALKVAPQTVSGLAWALVEDDEVEVHAAAAGIAMPMHE